MLQNNFILFMFAIICFAVNVNTSYADDTAALTLINVQGCKGCHILHKQGGTLGPALDGVGTRLTFEQIKKKLINPKLSTPTSMMPDYRHLSGQEQDLLIRYLSRLR